MDPPFEEVAFFVPDNASRCNQCGKRDKRSKLKRCAGCNVMVYCNKDCQKLAWPTHKHACSSSKTYDQRTRIPVTTHEQRVALLRSMGFPSMVSYGRALREWAEEHQWAFSALTRAIVALEGGAEALHIDSINPYFLYFSIVPNKAWDGCPATRFRLDGLGAIPIGDSSEEYTQQLMRSWEDARSGREKIDSSFRRARVPNYAGVVVGIYMLGEGDTGMLINTQYPAFRLRVRTPVDEPTRLVLSDVMGLCKGCINTGMSLHGKDEGDRAPMPGMMRRSGKKWNWQPLFKDGRMWNNVAQTLMPFYSAKSGLLPLALFERFADL